MIARTQHSRGLTLVELMLALMIGSVIMLGGASLLTTAIDTWQQGAERNEEMQVVTHTLGLIERHLRAAEDPAGGYDAVFRGEDLSLDLEQPGHRITLRSRAEGRFPRELPPVDAQEIMFEFDPEGEYGMIMRIHAPYDDYPLEGGYEIVMSELIEGFQIFYYDGASWLPEWYETFLPKAVEVHLMLRRGSDEDLELAAGGQYSMATTRKVSRLIWMPLGREEPAEGSGEAILDEEADSARAGGFSSRNSAEGGAR